MYAPHAVYTVLVAGGMCEIMNFADFQQSLGDIAMKFVSVYKIKFKELCKKL
jgi:hypothetical protein